MKETESLFDKGITNYNAAIVMRERCPDDEAFLNIAGYHLQQSLEFVIKYILEQNGVEYVKTHDIDQLIMLGKENDVDMYLTEYVEDHSEMFSQWEAKSRYILGYRIELKKIDRAIDELRKYFQAVEKAMR